LISSTFMVLAELRLLFKLLKTDFQYSIYCLCPVSAASPALTCCVCAVSAAVCSASREAASAIDSEGAGVAAVAPRRRAGSACATKYRRLALIPWSRPGHCTHG